jgi:hypothetical protein
MKNLILVCLTFIFAFTATANENVGMFKSSKEIVQIKDYAPDVPLIVDLVIVDSVIVPTIFERVTLERIYLNPISVIGKSLTKQHKQPKRIKNKRSCFIHKTILLRNRFIYNIHSRKLLYRGNDIRN